MFKVGSCVEGTSEDNWVMQSSLTFDFIKKTLNCDH